MTVDSRTMERSELEGKVLADHLNGRRIAGVRFEAATFTPREWVYPGQRCEGVRIVLTDRNRLDSPLLGVELMAALWRLYGDRLQIDRTLSMIGSRASLAAVKALADPRDVLTLLTGEEPPPLDALLAELESSHPELECEVHEGGQPHYPLLLSAE